MFFSFSVFPPSIPCSRSKRTICKVHASWIAAGLIVVVLKGHVLRWNALLPMIGSIVINEGLANVREGGQVGLGDGPVHSVRETNSELRLIKDIVSKKKKKID